MIRNLENILHDKTKDTQSEILFAQWNYDKKVIPSALQLVSNLFPHYSLHDESHSITIINNIVRLLGMENIAKLSAIDIWLILEASYCHDIGMVVSSEKIIESLNSETFIEFFNEIISDNKNGLYEFATQFKILDGKIAYKEDLFNIQLYDGIKFILAEYFRRIHSDRSKEIINNPLNELSILSPRSVIPPRIFKILGDICACHTKDFPHVLKLPFCEVGIDIEDAHPRFIACLLRVGDLLDLDNNRFSEVMLRTLSKVPVDTLNHKAKHLSIESFRVDRNIIEITARCENYDTANITQHWFNYLNKEIGDQMISWSHIVPFKDLGYLPTIGNLKVELSNYDYIDGKNKPKFSVDTNKALELLQGAGIYDGAYQCIREILQNATDATLMRIWLEHGNEKDFSIPNSTDFLTLVKEYPMVVKISEKGFDAGLKKWKLEIEDKGTGISSNDLKYLMNTGSSSKNIERTRIIEKMPVWMRPSGTFGIGFQSIFMLTDEIRIETKSFFNEEFQIIELNSPNSKKDGGILVQKKKTTHAIKPGTKIIFYHNTKAIPGDISIKGEHKNASKIAHNFDPFSHESLDVELGKILDEVYNFSKKSYIPIRLSIDGDKLETTSSNNGQFEYFDVETSLEFTFHSEKVYANSAPNKTFYKNQPVENRWQIHFLSFEVNVHKEKANKVLTLNRNKINPDYEAELAKEILCTSYNLVLKNFDSIFKTPNAKSVATMFLHYYSAYYDLRKYDLKNFTQWENFEVAIDNKNISLKTLLTSIKKLKLIYDNSFQTAYGDKYKLKDDYLEITLKNGQALQSSTAFYLFKLMDYFTCFHIKSVTERTKDPLYKKQINHKEIIFTKEPQYNFIKIEELIFIIIQLRNKYSYGGRTIIPCIEEFYVLRLRDNSYHLSISQYSFDSNIKLPFPKMLSPFVREEFNDNRTILKEVLNEKLYDWVYDNRYDLKITKEAIIEGYKSFCKAIDLEKINSD